MASSESAVPDDGRCAVDFGKNCSMTSHFSCSFCNARFHDTGKLLSHIMWHTEGGGKDDDEPKSAKSEPQSAKLELQSAKLEPESAKLEPQLTKSETQPTMSASEPTTSGPQTSISETQSSKSEPESTKSAPHTSVSEPQTSKSEEPQTSKSEEPQTTRPEPQAARSEPPTSQSESGIQNSQPEKMECTDTNTNQNDDIANKSKAFPIVPALSVAISSSIAVSPSRSESRKRPAEETSKEIGIESPGCLASPPKYFLNNTEVLISEETLRILTKGQGPPEKKMKLLTDDKSVLDMSKGTLETDEKEKTDNLNEISEIPPLADKSSNESMKVNEAEIKEKAIKDSFSSKNENQNAPDIIKTDDEKEQPMEVVTSEPNQVLPDTKIDINDVEIQSETKNDGLKNEEEIQSDIKSATSDVVTIESKPEKEKTEEAIPKVKEKIEISKHVLGIGEDVDEVTEVQAGSSKSADVIIEKTEKPTTLHTCTSNPSKCHFQTPFFTNFRQHIYIHHGTAVDTRIGTLYQYKTDRLEKKPRFYENPYSGVLQCSFCIANFRDQEEGTKHLYEEHDWDKVMLSCRLHACKFETHKLDDIVLHIAGHLGVVDDIKLPPKDENSIDTWGENKKPSTNNSATNAPSIPASTTILPGTSASKSSTSVSSDNSELPTIVANTEIHANKGPINIYKSTQIVPSPPKPTHEEAISSQMSTQVAPSPQKSTNVDLLRLNKDDSVQFATIVDSCLRKDIGKNNDDNKIPVSSDPAVQMIFSQSTLQQDGKIHQESVNNSETSESIDKKNIQDVNLAESGSGNFLIAVFKDIDFVIDEDIAASERPIIDELKESTGCIPSKISCPLPMCDASFSKIVHAVEHRRLHNGIKPFTCSYCEFQSAQESVMRTHIVRKHQSILKGTTRANQLVHDAATNTYVCPFCPSASVRFKSLTNAEAHIQIHEEAAETDMVYVCQICGFETLKRMEIVNHALYVNCKLETLKQKRGKSKLHDMHPDGPVIINSPSISAQSKLVGNTVFANQIESMKQTVANDSLQKMLALLPTGPEEKEGNDGKAKYKCSLCSFVAAHRSTVFYHIKNSHKRTQTECYDTYTYVIGEGEKSTTLTRNPQTGLYHCPFCDEKATRQSTSVFVHIRAVHTKERPYKCRYCSYDAFSWSDIFHHGKHWHDAEINNMILEISKKSETENSTVDHGTSEEHGSTGNETSKQNEAKILEVPEEKILEDPEKKILEDPEEKIQEDQEPAKQLDCTLQGSQKLTHWVVEETWVEGLGTSFTLKKADSSGKAVSSETEMEGDSTETDDADAMEVDKSADVNDENAKDGSSDAANVDQEKAPSTEAKDAIVTSGLVREVFLPANANVDYKVNISTLETVALTELNTFARYACDQCYLTISCINGNINHAFYTQQCHGRMPPTWYCSHCTCSFKQKSELVDHLKAKHEISSIDEAQKGQQIVVSQRAKDLVSQHIRVSHLRASPPFVCLMCDFRAMSAQHLSYHLNLCHRKLATDLPSISTENDEDVIDEDDLEESSESDGYIFKSGVFEKYMRKLKCPVTERYACGFCRFTFYHWMDLKNHVRSHINEYPYTCAKCKIIKTMTKSQMKRHVASCGVVSQTGEYGIKTKEGKEQTSSSGEDEKPSNSSATNDPASKVSLTDVSSAPILYQKLLGGTVTDAKEPSEDLVSDSATKTKIDEPMDTGSSYGKQSASVEDIVMLEEAKEEEMLANGYLSSSNSFDDGSEDGSRRSVSPFSSALKRARRRHPHEMEPGPQLGIDYVCDLNTNLNDVKDLLNVCPYCGRDFTSQNNLVIHLRTHTGEKPYHCLHCGFSSGYDTSIRRHFRLNRCHVLRMKMQAANDPTIAQAMITNVDKAVKLVSSIKEELRGKEGLDIENEVPQVGKDPKERSDDVEMEERLSEDPAVGDLVTTNVINDTEKGLLNETNPGDKTTKEGNMSPIILSVESVKTKPAQEVSKPGPVTAPSGPPIHQLHHMSSKLGNKLVPTVGYKAAGPIQGIHYTFTPTAVEESAVITLRTSQHLDCMICKQRSDSLDEAISHLRSHTGDKPFKCGFCQYRTAHELAIKNHYRLFHFVPDPAESDADTSGDKSKDVTLPEWPTFFAKRRFIDFDFQVSERERRAVSMFIQSGSAKCEVCKVMLNDRFSVTNHIRKHNNEKPYLCLHCHERFDAANQMANHLQYDHSELNQSYQPPTQPPSTVVNSKPVVVKNEPRTSPARANIETASKNNDPMQLEPVWPRHFALRRNIDFTFTMTAFEREALKTFFRNGVYTCAFCSAPCKTRIDITAHVRRHNQEKPYKCCHCHATFDSAMPMMVHCDQYHKEKKKEKQESRVTPSTSPAAATPSNQIAVKTDKDALSSLYGMDSIKNEIKKPYLNFPRRGTDYFITDEAHLQNLRLKYQCFTEYFCPKCQLESPTIEDALDHMVEDHAFLGFQRSFECAKCYEKFNNEKTVRNHIVVHHTRSSVMAEKLFAEKEMCQQVGEEFRCLGCGEVCATKLDYNCHRRQCEELPEYFCTMCPYKHNTKAMVISHCFKTHTTHLKLERDPFTGNFLCTFCNKVWTHLNKEAKTHDCKMNGIGTWYVCKDCNFTSMEKSVVLLHKLFYHSDRAQEFVLPGQLVTTQNATVKQNQQAINAQQQQAVNMDASKIRVQVASPASGRMSSPNTASSNQSSPRQIRPAVMPMPIKVPSDPKPPKPPNKPITAYIRYSKSTFNSIKSKNPNMMVGEIGRIIGSMWKKLTTEEKEVYHKQYINDKLRYEKEMMKYHDSEEYRKYIAEKSKAKEPPPIKHELPPIMHESPPIKHECPPTPASQKIIRWPWNNANFKLWDPQHKQEKPSLREQLQKINRWHTSQMQGMQGAPMHNPAQSIQIAMASPPLTPSAAAQSIQIAMASPPLTPSSRTSEPEVTVINTSPVGNQTQTSPNVSEEMTTYKCEICGKGFWNHTGYEYHLKHYHTQEYMWQKQCQQVAMSSPAPPQQPIAVPLAQNLSNGWVMMDQNNPGPSAVEHQAVVAEPQTMAMAAIPVPTGIYTSKFYEEHVSSPTDSPQPPELNAEDDEPCEIIEPMSEDHVGVLNLVRNESTTPTMQMPVIANVVSLSQSPIQGQ